MRPLPTLAAALTMTMLLAAPALAQPAGPGSGRGPRPPRLGALDAARSEAAWKLEARSVARRLALGEEAQATLVKAYVEARTRHRTAVEKIRANRGAGDGQKKDHGQGDPGAGPDRAGGEGRDRDRGGAEGPRRRWRRMREALRSVAETERTRLKTALEPLVGAEALESAMAPLGTFDRRWDALVDAVAGFKLEPEKTFTALAPIERYVVSVAGAARGGDRRGLREKARAARDRLATDLGSVLDEAQVAEITKKLTPRRGGRRRPPAAGGA